MIHVAVDPINSLSEEQSIKAIKQSMPRSVREAVYPGSSQSQQSNNPCSSLSTAAIDPSNQSNNLCSSLSDKQSIREINQSTQRAAVDQSNQQYIQTVAKPSYQTMHAAVEPSSNPAEQSINHSM
jgi:hypothetical protein